MKKLLFSLALLAIGTSASLAYIEAASMADVESARKQGFSESTLRVLDTTRAHHQGHSGTYTNHFKLKKSPYYYLKTYVDPASDDGHFGEHEINFSNSWTGERTHYDSPRKEWIPQENL